MRRIPAWLLVILALVATLPVLAQDPAVNGGWSHEDGLRYQAKDGDFNFTLHGHVQARATSKDPELGDSGESFTVPRAKLGLVVEAMKYWSVTLQADLSQGSQDGNSLLEDAFIQYKKHTLAQLWLGQGKVQFGRQALTSSAKLQFVDRAIATTEFSPTGEREDNRDVGIALIGENRAKTYAYSVGVYNGNGINKDEKDNSDYMGVARLVVMPFGEYPLTEVAVSRPDRPRLAIGISAVSLTRGTAALEEKIRDTTAALEFGFAYAGLNMAAEYFTRSGTQPDIGANPQVESDGWYFQSGYLFRNDLEIALRYSEILRDIIDNDETEAGIAVNYYVRDHDMKVQFDYRVLEFEAPPQTPKIDNNIFRFQLQFAF